MPKYIFISIAFMLFISCGGTKHPIAPSPYDDIAAQLVDNTDSSYIEILNSVNEQKLKYFLIPPKHKIITWADSENLLISKYKVVNKKIVYQYYIANISNNKISPITEYLSTKIINTEYITNDYLNWIYQNDTIVAFQDIVAITGDFNQETYQKELEYTKSGQFNDTLYLIQTVDYYGNQNKWIFQKSNPFFNVFSFQKTETTKIYLENFTNIQIVYHNILYQKSENCFQIIKKIDKIQPNFRPEKLITARHAEYLTLGMTKEDAEKLIINHYSFQKDSNYNSKQITKYNITNNDKLIFECFFQKTNQEILKQINIYHPDIFLKEGVKLQMPLTKIAQILPFKTYQNNQATTSIYPNLLLFFSDSTEKQPSILTKIQIKPQNSI